MCVYENCLKSVFLPDYYHLESREYGFHILVTKHNISYVRHAHQISDGGGEDKERKRDGKDGEGEIKGKRGRERDEKEMRKREREGKMGGKAGKLKNC